MEILGVVEMKWKEVECRIGHKIEVAAYKALRELGLPCSEEGMDAAHRRLRDEAPLYVGRIVVHGKTIRDMYDERPGFAHFDVEDLRAYRVPAFCGLARAKGIALELYAAADVACEDEEPHDGMFVPEYVVLEDCFGSVLQEYRRGCGKTPEEMGWIESFADESEWPVLLDKADNMRDEASTESRWDNFETARRLQAQASALERLVRIAQVRSRVIP